MNKWMIFFIGLLCLAGLCAPFLRSHDAKFYFDRGSDTLSTASPGSKWAYRWDLNSAESDFGHAIRLNPNFAAAYASRAGVEFMRGDADEAIKDYTSAIGLSPQDPTNYAERARIEAAGRDFKQALVDYEKVIELQPGNRNAYRGRMRIREMQNDFAGAMMERVRMIEEMGPTFTGPTLTNSDSFARNPDRQRDRFLHQLDRALANDTNFAWGYYYRGVFKSLTNDWDGALADFQRCQDLPDGKVRDYAAIHTWLVQTRIGEREKANQQLLAYCQNRTNGTPADWQMQIAKFLLNQTGETDFFKALDPADTGRARSEFWYYTGMKHLLAGDKAGASDCFRQSLGTQTRPCAIFFSAGAELSSLSPVAPAE
jgi:tetratricopeptide (TPR) repeat protein